MTLFVEEIPSPLTSSAVSTNMMTKQTINEVASIKTHIMHLIVLERL